MLTMMMVSQSFSCGVAEAEGSTELLFSAQELVGEVIVYNLPPGNNG
jgi:hypothetical protein